MGRSARRRSAIRRGTDRRGTTTVELAFVLPVVLIMIFGTMSISMALYAYNTIAEASRAGARYAITHGVNSSSPAGPTANDANVTSAAKTAAFSLVQSSLSVTSSWLQSDNKAGSSVKVTVSYTCPTFATKLLGLNPFVISSSSTMIITN